MRKSKRSRNKYIKWRKELLDALFILFKHECVYCSKPLNKKTATIDHKIPLSKGGLASHIDNTQLTCKKCNGEKGSMTHQDYYFRKFGKKL